MRHRDYLSLKQFQEEEALREAAAKEQRERKEAAARAIREAARKADQESIRREFHRDLVLEGAQDTHFLLNIEPEMVNIRMTAAEAEKFNTEQAEKFVRENPEYLKYKSDATFRAMAAYLEKNGARIVSAQMLKVVFERLRTLNIIHRNPEPKPAPTPKAVNLTIEKPTYGDNVNGGVLGRDWETGKDKVFSPREVERMSSVEYKRAFPTVQTIAEWLTASADIRGAARS